MTKAEKKPGPQAAKGDEQRITVGVVLSRETVDMLNEMARYAGVSRSHFLRGLIKNRYDYGDRKDDDEMFSKKSTIEAKR